MIYKIQKTERYSRATKGNSRKPVKGWQAEKDF